MKIQKLEKINLTFHDAPIAHANIKLKKLFGDPWGATYISDKPRMTKLVWLFNVTQVVMGKHPDEIYIRVA